MTEAMGWPSQWLRGALPLCVLRVVSEQPTHGYGIATALEREGLGTIAGGTLYPMLGRLERDGLLEAEWVAGSGGPGRKVYAITAAGSGSLADDGAAWIRFAHLTAAAIGRSTTASGAAAPAQDGASS